MEDPFDALDAPPPRPKHKDGLVDDQEFFSLTRLKGLLREDGSKTGYVMLTDDDFWPRAKYEVQKKADGTATLKIWREATKNSAQFFQEVRLDKVRVNFGWRPFMVCGGCGELRSKIHFSPLGTARCRECLNLTYESSRGNHSHPMFRLARRYLKIRLKQAEIRRITYGDGLTKRAQRLMALSARWLSKEEKDKVDRRLAELRSRQSHNI